MKNELIGKFKNKYLEFLDRLELIEDDIEELANVIADQIQNKRGRIIFVGAGISSEITKVIIEELWFTFQISSDILKTLTAAKQYAESLEKWKELEEYDSVSVFELEDIKLKEDDILIGLSASGKTQYVISALTYAKNIGCKTALISDVENVEVHNYIDYFIDTKFGNPSIIGLNSVDGSTIQKMVLDSIIYLAMEKIGRLWKDMPCFMLPVSSKIRSYCINVIIALFNKSWTEADKLLSKYNNKLEVVIVCEINNISYDEAIELIHKFNGNLNMIIKE